MNPYSSIPDAMALFELPSMAWLWDILRNSGADTETAFKAIRIVIADTLANPEHRYSTRRRMLVAAKPQMDHKEFKQYVAAKLGAM